MSEAAIELLEPGDVTVVGFRGDTFLGATHIPLLQESINRIINEHQPKVLQFDLSGVALLTSDMLGFFISIKNRGIDIALYNPSEDVRKVIEVTRLDELFDLTQ